MKVVKYLLLLILLIPFSVYAKTCSNEEVIIKSIEKKNSSDGAEEIDTPTIENNKININISMSEVNDYIEYKFNVENKTEEDLVFNGNSLTSEDTHFTYQFSYEDDSNIIPANNNKDVTMKVTYTKEVEESELNNGSYQIEETKKVGIMDSTLINPKTSNTFYVILFIIISTITVLGLTILKNKCMALLFLVFLIPYTVYAACSFEMELCTNIEVKNTPDPVSFATDSWDTIAKAVRSNNTSVYNVGDTKEITLDGFGTHTLRIANKSTVTECSGEGFSQTACGFVIEFADSITEYNMNPSGTYKGTNYPNGWNVDGWPASAMNTYLNDTTNSSSIINSLPSQLKRVIIDTKVVSGHGNTSGESNFTSMDKLYLLSAHEVYEDIDGNTNSGLDYYDTAYYNTRQLDYYANLGVTLGAFSMSNYSYEGNYDDDIKPYNGSNYTSWWFRTAYSFTDDYFDHTTTHGNLVNSYASQSFSVSPAFKIG